MYSCWYVHPNPERLQLYCEALRCVIVWARVWMYLKSSVYSRSSCINKRWSSVFHTPEPGDSHVPQLLHARCLIVQFVYLAAPFHFLCCWRWENTQQYSHDSALPPSPFLSSQHPPPFSSLTPSLDSVLPHSLSISSKRSLRKKLWSDSQSNNNANVQPCFSGAHLVFD